MLEPGSRRLFLDSLRPPEGCRFDRAIGTTFTLDLLALLSVPLAFTFRDAQDGDGYLASNPIALLEGARRHASNIVVFAQGGQTFAPRPGQAALAFLEGSVIAAAPPQRGGAEVGVFHPKIWVLRYLRSEESVDESEVRYRLVCQSRNLTFDASWDISLVLDGPLRADRTNRFSRNAPLAEFIRALPAFALQQPTASQLSIVEDFAEEIGRVEFELPEGFDHLEFLPFGLSARNQRYPGLHHRPLLVVSPFLDGTFNAEVTKGRPDSILVSRRGSLAVAAPSTVAGFKDLYAFRSGLEPEPEDVDDEQLPTDALGVPTGLHAKLYVVDDGWDTRVGIGSANATAAALGSPSRNVEFLVELIGKKSRFGIDALLSIEGADVRAGSFRTLIEEFPREEVGQAENDDELERLGHVLEVAATAIARLDLAARAEVNDSGHWQLTVDAPELPALPPEVDRVQCWPVTLPRHQAHDLVDGVRFEDLSLTDVVGFLVVAIRARSDDKREQERRFVLPLPIEGLPEDRLQRLLASMVSNRERLMELLWLLLLPDGELSAADLAGIFDKGEAGAWRSPLPGLLERMLETLARDPERLLPVNALVEDLLRTEQGTELLGEEFTSTWNAIWSAARRHA